MWSLLSFSIVHNFTKNVWGCGSVDFRRGCAVPFLQLLRDVAGLDKSHLSQFGN